jgi:hypothetical protein
MNFVKFKTDKKGIRNFLPLIIKVAHKTKIISDIRLQKSKYKKM